MDNHQLQTESGVTDTPPIQQPADPPTEQLIGQSDHPTERLIGQPVRQTDQMPNNMIPIEEANGKKAVTSLVIGIILNVLNLGMLCSAFMGGGFLYGGLFIIFAIMGITNANVGKHSNKKGMAIVGLILNILALVCSVLLIILGVIATIFSDN